MLDMAYVEKRIQSNGAVTYRARVRQKGAPSLSSSFHTKRQAVEWAQRMEAEVRAGRYFGLEEDREKTFAQFVDRYIEKELPKNPKGYAKQKLLLSWWKSHLGKYFLCHITPSSIAELRDRLLSEMTPKGTLRTPSTTNRYLAALSRAFTICQREWRWIKENPVLKITRPKENKPRDRYLEKEEIHRLLEVCKKSKSPYLYAIVLFALSTGARKGEILSLTWDDVDFARMTAIFRDTKNGETRAVHLSATIIGRLKEEKERRVVLSNYVFPNHNGTKPADIKTAWENAVKETGLKNVCFHSLRHTAASHLSMGGFSPLEIAAVLGHKTLAMVKRYSHLSISATARALDRLNDEIFGDVMNG
jgi:integrase